jgi:hypothetical protein
MPVFAVAATLVEEPPQFEYRDGMFYATTFDGYCRCFRPITFFQMLAQAAQVAREYRVVSGEVVDFAAHAAAVSGRPSK